MMMQSVREDVFSEDDQDHDGPNNPFAPLSPKERDTDNYTVEEMTTGTSLRYKRQSKRTSGK